MNRPNAAEVAAGKLAFLLIAIAVLGAFLLSDLGCAASDPTVKADTQQLTSVNTQIAALQKQIATVSTQPAATQPASAVDPTPLLTALDAKLNALKSDQAAANAKLAADTDAIKTQQITQGAQIAATVSAAAPFPWSSILELAIPVIAAVAISRSHGQTVAQTAANGADALGKAAQTMQNSSNNHTAVMGQMITALANSAPVTVPAAAMVAVETKQTA